eukprot:4125942-Pleurochrysis_carterae.AAC.1
MAATGSGGIGGREMCMRALSLRRSASWYLACWNEGGGGYNGGKQTMLIATTKLAPRVGRGARRVGLADNLELKELM